MARIVTLALIPMLVAVGIVSTQPSQSASAVVGGDFNPGNIIADSVFYDSTALTEAQIQAFLNARIGTCTNGRCLNVLNVSVASRERTVSDSTGNVRCEAFEGGFLSAAAIIFRAQTACGISARVLLVTLQKEQGLVTKTAPSEAALDRAMGLACPDTALCAPRSLGFGNQVYGGALQLSTYRASRFGIQPGVRSIQWHPNAACGSSIVDIQNHATAALYNYTPYRPNAAALANVGAVGDACSSYGNRNFWVYYNNWFGSTFGAPPQTLRNSAVGEPPIYLVARDLAGNLFSYPQTGTGGWGQSGLIGTGWSAMTTILAAGDFSGSGRQSFLARDGAGVLWLYERDGTGGWLQRKAAGFGWNVFDTILMAGDFSGDGRSDVIARTPDGTLWLYTGNGTGGWQARSVIGFGWQGFDMVLAPGDMNGDDFADLVARNASGQLLLYPGDGRGGFAASSVISGGWQSYTAVSAGSDFDGDGRVDLFARDRDGILWLFPGTGSGSLTARRSVGTGWNAMSFLLSPSDTRHITAMTPIAPDPAPGTGDFTGDNKRDILARDPSGALRLYPGNGSGGWLPTRQIPGDWSEFTSVFGVGDFSGRGGRDEMAIDQNGSLWLYTSNGRGGVLPRALVGSSWSQFTAAFGGGDFDGDNNPDVIARDTSGSLLLYPGNGSGGWGARMTIGTGWQGFTAILPVGDFNGDSHQDVMARDQSGNLWLYRGDGAGGWAGRTLVGMGWEIYSSVVGVGDFTGDNNSDVMARSADGRLILWPGNGSGGWLSPTTVGVGWNGFSLLG